MELVTLTSKEIRRLEVVQALDARTLCQPEAARLLDLSMRQVKRLLRRYRQGGAPALASARRGCTPNNALAADLQERVLELYRQHYPDFGPTLAVEKLRERHGIHISRETLRTWLIAHDLWRASKRRAHPRPPRARRRCAGELVQIDGSPHRWFEERGARCTLLLAIDDATGRVGAGHFATAETTNAYFELFEQYFRKHGLPEAFYSDRHSIFRINTTLAQDSQTQVARALAELDIELICANSPQAKGRVERANRTMQDRLIKELRLQHIATIADANAFLPTFIDDYNRQFAKMPASDFDAHRTSEPFNLTQILAHRFERTLTANLTVQIENDIYAISELHSRHTLRAGMRVQLHRQRDGVLTITHNGQSLQYRHVQRVERNPAIVPAKELAERPAKWQTMPQKAHIPKPNHPWRNSLLPKAKGDTSALQAGDITALR